MFVTDVIVRKKDYSTPDLYDPNGRYGKWNVQSFVILAVGTILGWGLVVNTAANWLTWRGYLLFLIGSKDGSWASANLGVIVALLVGLFGALAFQREHRQAGGRPAGIRNGGCHRSQVTNGAIAQEGTYDDR